MDQTLPYTHSEMLSATPFHNQQSILHPDQDIQLSAFGELDPDRVWEEPSSSSDQDLALWRDLRSELEQDQGPSLANALRNGEVSHQTLRRMSHCCADDPLCRFMCHELSLHGLSPKESESPPTPCCLFPWLSKRFKKVSATAVSISESPRSVSVELLLVSTVSVQCHCHDSDPNDCKENDCDCDDSENCDCDCNDSGKQHSNGNDCEKQHCCENILNASGTTVHTLDTQRGIQQLQWVSSDGESPLFSHALSLDTLTTHSLLVRVWDQDTGLPVAYSLFDPLRLLEASLGASSPVPLTSPLTNSADFLTMDPKTRLRVSTVGERVLCDLLGSGSVQHTQLALRVLHRLVQFTELPAVAESHPLRRFMQSHRLQSLFLPLVTLPAEHSSMVHSAVITFFTTGIARFGPLFARALQPFGEELARLADAIRFGEDACASALEVLRLSPLCAQVEAVFTLDSPLVESLTWSLHSDRSEDSQVRALVFLNAFLESVHESPSITRRFLALLPESVVEYVGTGLESWHPQISEESLRLFHVLFVHGRVQLDETLVRTLTGIEVDNHSGKLARIVQEILFEHSFALVQFKLALEWSDCAGPRYVFPLSNVLSHRLPPFHSASGQSCVRMALSLSGDSVTDVARIHGNDSHSQVKTSHGNDTVIVTHVAAALPENASASVTLRFILTSELPELPLSTFDSPSQHTLHMHEQHPYAELQLDSPTPARYALVELSTGLSSLQLDYVAVFGKANGEENSRDSSELLGRIGPLTGLRVRNRSSLAQRVQRSSLGSSAYPVAR